MGTAPGFWSYVRKDDEGMHGAIRRVAEHLQDEYGVITGDLELDLFFDGMKLKWGDKWRLQIRQAIEDSMFFIPIITPRYFKSEECLSQAEFHGDSESRILSWGLEILPSHATTEEVPRRAVGPRRPPGL